jgi:hypothetical protein
MDHNGASIAESQTKGNESNATGRSLKVIDTPKPMTSRRARASQAVVMIVQKAM